MSNTTMAGSVVEEAADRLLRAAATGQPCAPIRDLVGATNASLAYAVQQVVTETRIRAGSSVVGRKIGLTSAAVQRQFDVDQPDFGSLFDDMEYVGGDELPIGRFIQPMVGAEIAFMLAEDLTGGDLDLAQVRNAIGYATAALEVCDSRVAGWDVSFADTVADNASAGAYVLGPLRRRLDDFEPKDVTMTMSLAGQEVSQGEGTACLGDPLAAVQWLARKARELGDPLRAGQLVLSGALGPLRPAVPGDRVCANLVGLGAVSCRFSKAF